MSICSDAKSYFLGIPSYLFNRNNSSPIKLAMAMQVKDERDIVELNIRYHALKGCSAFFVMDNNSTDGTREILESLKTEFEIYLYSDFNMNFSQSKNMTFLTNEARKKGFDWVIENDADEFWYPHQGDLLWGLDRKKTVLKAKLYHMQSTTSDYEEWWKSPLRTEHTINYDFSNPQLKAEEANIRLGAGTHKVMVNTRGFVRVTGGQHSARHAWDKIKGRKAYGVNSNITIYHFGIRGYSQFEQKARNIKASIEYADSNGHKHGFSRWAVLRMNALNEGKLTQAYKRLLLNPNSLNCLKEIGILVEDHRMLEDEDFRKALKETASEVFDK
jgi:glycosyltransferase involved in cell wall biosynthesis